MGWREKRKQERTRENKAEVDYKKHITIQEGLKKEDK